MNNPTCTINDVLGWEPCEDYTEEVITELFAGRERLSAEEILDMDIPAADRLWAVLREELLPAELLHKFGCWCAAIALHRKREPDDRSWAAVETKWRWIHGAATNDELTAAWEAAEAAAEAAAGAAAWPTAWAAAWAAAWPTAWAATRAEQAVLLKELIKEADAE